MYKNFLDRYLSNNRITTVESNAFDELHHLSVLYEIFIILTGYEKKYMHCKAKYFLNTYTRYRWLIKQIFFGNAFKRNEID